MQTEILNKIFLLNLFELMPPIYSYFLCCLGAIFAGIVVGKEREKAQKAAGLRTFAMVALGSCIFTLTSRLMMGTDGGLVDGARIPAQIVSGVGFLGAGAVFRSGRIVTGLTTAAGIWSTAAVGLVFGLGFFTFGLSVTLMIYVLLSFQSLIERKHLRICEWSEFHIHVDQLDGKGPLLINEINHDWGHKMETLRDLSSHEVQVLKIKLCPDHRPHQRFLSELAAQPFVLKILKT
jgi:putative Mg2+ transporter-C (MgtC) family protein